MYKLEYELKDGTIIETPYTLENNTQGIELLVSSILELKKENKKYRFKDDNQELFVNASEIKSVKIIF